MIKALIFDNNGVLTENEDAGIIKMANFLGISPTEYRKVTKEYIEQLDLGTISTENFLKEVAGHFEKKVDIEILKNLQFSWFDRDEEMYWVVKSLGDRFELALLSNFGDGFDKFEERWRIAEIIKPENIFVSAKLGMVKPHKEIFEYALEKLGFKPHETIFIDDNQNNIEAAQNLGMKGILFTGKEQFLCELEGVIAND